MLTTYNPDGPEITYTLIGLKVVACASSKGTTERKVIMI